MWLHKHVILTQEVEIVSLGQPWLYLRLSQNKNRTQEHCHFKIDQTTKREGQTGAPTEE